MNPLKLPRVSENGGHGVEQPYHRKHEQEQYRAAYVDCKVQYLLKPHIQPQKRRAPLGLVTEAPHQRSHGGNRRILRLPNQSSHGPLVYSQKVP